MAFSVDVVVAAAAAQPYHQPACLTLLPPSTPLTHART